MELNDFKRFAKKKDINEMTNNAVVYTRVSSKEQADDNASLETQLKYCNEYAKRKGLNIVEYFGGTYESAKSDERKEFQKMLTFLNKRKSISYVIVFSYDRFSRTGANAAYISSNLKKRGIHTISVSQDVDTSKPSGVFQENLYYMFSQFDNEMRKDKTITGVREKMRQGYWCVRPPFGYINTNKGSSADKSNIILNEDGKMVRRVFKWIFNNGWTIKRASEETAKYNRPIKAKRLSEILRNPFYAGLITGNIIAGEVYEGKHERCVTPELFSAVNEILDGKKISRKGIQMQNKLNDVPLRGTLICEYCGHKMTGYKASKNQKFYYKCNTKGCKNNQRADEVHESFKNLLSYFIINPNLKDTFKEILSEDFSKRNKDNKAKKQELDAELKTIDNKLEKLEEKYLFEDVDKNIYQKHLTKLQAKKTIILKDLEQPEIKLSNLENFYEMATEISANLLKVWSIEDYDNRVSIQETLFPMGLFYDRKNENYRTEKINSFLVPSKRLSKLYKSHKKSGNLILNEKSASVPPPRLELGSTV